MSSKFLFQASVLTLIVLAAATGRAGDRTGLDFIPPDTQFIAGHTGDLSPHFVGKAPAAFCERNGHAWTQRLSGPTGTFRRIWGAGIGVDPQSMDDSKVAEKEAELFWSANADLLPTGVFPEDQVLLSSTFGHGIRFVSHQQTIDQIPVLGTGSFLAISDGRIVLIGSRNFPVNTRIPHDTQPKITTGIIDIAVSALRGLNVEANFKAREPQLAFFPLVGDDRLSLRLVYSVELSAPKISGRWTVYVDASDGEIVAIRNERIQVEGELKLGHHDLNRYNGNILSPAAHIEITSGDNNYVTDAQGAFSIPGTADGFTAMLKGPYVDVTNGAGADAILTIDPEGGLSQGESYIWTLEGLEERQAQNDGYAFTTQVRAYAKRICGDLNWFDETLPVNVNLQADLTGNGQPDTCNAFFDGESINFLPSGSSCENTAMVGDVIFHEYGHATHFASIVSGGDFDEASSEGFADTMATSITGDNVLGRYFFGTNSGLRDLEPDKIWPQDQASDPHATGLILGGTLWDLRKLLKEKHGDEDGEAIIENVFAGAMRTTTTIPTSFEASLLADDDDGDLSNGTPHACDLYTAFSAHGLFDEQSGSIAIEHTVLEEIGPDEVINVEAKISVGLEMCFTLGRTYLEYSEDGESWIEVDMTSSDDTYQAQIPAMPIGTELYYRINVVEEENSQVITRPSNLGEPFYKIYIGPLEQIIFEDFEEEDDQWTHELISGQAREGADDWQRGKPGGRGGDPTSAYSGYSVWGNDLSPQPQWDGMYQQGIKNSLQGPKWDLSQYDSVRVQFRRWLSVWDGTLDKATLYVNDEPVWTNTASDERDTPHSDEEWILFDLDITEQAAGQSEVQLRWEINTAFNGVQSGGWNIDDVALYYAPVPKSDDDTDDDIDDDTDDEFDTDTEPQAGPDEGENMDGVDSVAGCGCKATGSGSGSISLTRVLTALF